MLVYTMESNKHANAKIYKITDIGYNECYYWSTMQLLPRRMAHHRAYYAQYKQQGFPNTTSLQLFEKYGIETCKIELVEK